ncbi:MAG: fucose isomerase [Clostridia bacterium]|nr:fucose isomerase [Clostridia bacterium]
MLKNVPKILSPELLKILAEMGHGDEILIADGNFPSASNAQRLVRADGHGGVEILKAVLTMIPLDTYAEQNFILMETTQGDPTPTIWAEYFDVANAMDDNLREGTMERQAFYERSRKAYAIIATGESAIYANILIKKGVI